MSVRFGKTSVIAIAVAAFAIGLAPTLSNCASDGISVERVAEAIGVDPYRLSDSGSHELTRFNNTFQTYASDPQNTRQLKQFRDAYKRIRSSYVQEISESKLIDTAIRGVQQKNPAPHSLPATDVVELALDAMTASLDPHSAYLNPEELRESEMVTSGEFGGLGIQVTQEDSKIKVISPIEGTPADRAGVKPGDIIVQLDGRPVEGMTLRDAVNAMRGQPGTTIRLTLVRDGGAAFDLSLTRAVITIEPVRWRMEADNIGYLRIVSFNERTGESVEQAMNEMRKAQPHLKGIVIDLRNNPGGLLDQSLAVADEFLDNGVLVTIRGRDAGSERGFWANAGDLARDVPLVVLVNSGSASASEIVAAALQDHGRATVMGTRSFGKGSVQTVMRLPIEGALKLTTALYYSPSGEAIQARGVIPNITLSGAEDKTQEAHETDLPGSLPAKGEGHHTTTASVDVQACPLASDGKDRELGCAVSYLRAGSADRFLAQVGTKPKL